MEDAEVAVLRRLIHFLHDYAASVQPQPARRSLGKIFATVLLRTRDGPLPLPQPFEVNQAAAVLDFMIANAADVFRADDVGSLSKAHRPPPPCAFMRAFLWKKELP